MRTLLYKIKVILKSKFRKNEFEGDWHKERYEICKNCDYNSMNTKSNSLRWKFHSLINGFKTFCTLCGCSIKDKTSVETERCSLSKIKNRKPKWKEYYEN